MKLRFFLAAAAALALPFAVAAPARAEVLETSTQPQVTVRAHVPSRGMSMAQVERRFGAPLEKMPAAGGDAPLHPVINRWRYGGYIVYFERNRVIHSVIDGSLPNF